MQRTGIPGGGGTEGTEVGTSMIGVEEVFVVCAVDVVVVVAVVCI